MAFEEIVKGSKFAVKSVTMAARLHDGKTGKHVAFNIPINLLVEIGWQDNQGIEVHEGTGSDAGFLLLRPGKNGYKGYRATDNSATLHMKVLITRFKSYVLNECPVEASEVQFSADNAGIIVQCPDWLRFNPQSKRG